MQLGDRFRNFLKLAFVLILDITDFIILGKFFFFLMSLCNITRYIQFFLLE